MQPNPTRYAKSGGVHVAYQVHGRGDVDLVFAPGAVSNLDVYWEHPGLAGWFREVSSFTRLILFDKRGTGLSDREMGSPTLDERTDDIRAVMDAAGSKSAVLFGLSEGATMSALFAATYPHRTRGLILFGGYARGSSAPDYPWGRTQDSLDRIVQQIDNDWDGYIGGFATDLAPSRGTDDAFKAWVSRLVRQSSTPSSEIARRRLNFQIDIRPVLPAIRAPTLVLHPTDDAMVPVQSGRILAEGVHGARFIEYPSTDHGFWASAGSSAFVGSQVKSFVERLRGVPESDRFLTTVLFTDIVGSTALASSKGDAEWGKTLAQYFAAVDEAVHRFHGERVKRLGDGALATFDGPTRAVRCACEIRDRVRLLSLETRSGLHTGECVRKDRDIEGIAIHLASRLTDKAQPGEVLVSGTVRDLSAGAGLRFVDRGSRPLRGIDGRVRMFSAQLAEPSGDGIVPPTPNPD